MANKKLSIIQEAVLAVIPSGLDNPVSTKDITEKTGLSMREVRAVISTLIIDHGVPIGGIRADKKHGYYLITTEYEREKATIPLKNQVVNMQQRINQLEKIKI